jgi:hypothetical protein
MPRGTGASRSVLMIAGANFVHSVVFRQVEWLKRSQRYMFSGLGFGVAEGRRGHAEPEMLFERFAQLPPRVGRPRDVKSAIGLLPHMAAALISRPSLTECGTWKQRSLDRATDRRVRPFFQELFTAFDLYHWHYFGAERLSILRHLPPGGKLIVTLWGSDLYRTAGIQEYVNQFEACKKVTVFTMATPEMREAFLAKFGRHLAEKVRLLNYGACNLDNIDRVRQQRACCFKRFGIPAGKIVVCIGNSGVAGNQHVPALLAIGEIEPQLLNKIALVLPMTYGLHASYSNEIREAASKVRAPVIVIDEFLTDEEISLLRCCTDIAIHVPVSDQFSASMCEALYAGSVLITGSWLPYSRLRMSDVVFHEIAAVEDVGRKLAQVIQNLECEREKVSGNAEPIRQLMSWQQVTQQWLALYDQLAR